MLMLMILDDICLMFASIVTLKEFWIKISFKLRVLSFELVSLMNWLMVEDIEKEKMVLNTSLHNTFKLVS